MGHTPFCVIVFYTWKCYPIFSDSLCHKLAIRTLVGAVHFSATGIIQSPDFLEPAYQGDEYLKELNPKSDHFRPRGNGYREVGYPEVINL